jgi:hypothetical protein
VRLLCAEGTFYQRTLSEAGYSLQRSHCSLQTAGAVPWSRSILVVRMAGGENDFCT